MRTPVTATLAMTLWPASRGSLRRNVALAAGVAPFYMATALKTAIAGLLVPALWRRAGA